MDKELNTKQLVDATFWLKPRFKLISFGSNFFHLAKVLATKNSEPELALITMYHCSDNWAFFHKSKFLLALLHVAGFQPARQRYLASQNSKVMY